MEETPIDSPKYADATVKDVGSAQDLKSKIEKNDGKSLIVVKLEGCGACIKTMEAIKKLKDEHPELRILIVDSKDVAATRTYFSRCGSAYSNLAAAFGGITAYPTVIGVHHKRPSAGGTRIKLRIRQGYMPAQRLLKFINVRSRSHSAFARSVGRELARASSPYVHLSRPVVSTPRGLFVRTYRR